MFSPNGTVTDHQVFAEGFLKKDGTVWGEYSLIHCTKPWNFQCRTFARICFQESAELFGATFNLGSPERLWGSLAITALNAS